MLHSHGILKGFGATFNLVVLPPSNFIRYTFNACRLTSSLPMKTLHFKPNRAATVAVYNTVLPAPVSAITRGLPICFASNAWPIVVNFMRTGMIQIFSFKVDFSPTHLLVSRSKAKIQGMAFPHNAPDLDQFPLKLRVILNFSYWASGSSSAGIRVSDTNRPP